MAKQQQPNIWVEALQTMGLSVLMAFGIRQFVAEARVVPTGSMRPTVEINDRLFIEKISYRFQTPQRGDIIVFRAPRKALEAANATTGDAYLKRIIGLPGETVEVRDGKVFIDNQPLVETYIKAPPVYTWGPSVVPEGQYLVLGDNRNGSSDGHVWGFLPGDSIIGRATARFWPPNRVGGLE
ncbi:MAG: signal peptidase I [Cyanobacteria bacterium J06606_4]